MKLAFACAMLAVPVLCVASDGWVSALRPRGKPGRQVTLAAKGKTDYVIVLPDTPSTQDRKAADDLSHWLHEMTGAEFRVVSESGPDAGRRFISIGRTRLVLSLSKDGDRQDPLLGDEGYAIQQDGENLFLTGGRRRGPINAVYALLEEDLGCRWYDRYTPDIPRKPDLRIGIVSRSYSPALDIRDPFYWDAFEPDWALRNRTNAPWVKVFEEWGGNTDYAWFGHSFEWLVPEGQYFKDHPEYFSVNGGKRTTSQLCMTNPDVLRITVDKIKGLLREHPNSELVSVSQNDRAGYCQCPECEKINKAEGGFSGALIQFCNRVADALRDEFPNVKVSTLSYMGTVAPPKTIRPSDRVVVQLCTDRHAWKRPFFDVLETEQFQSAMKGWHAIGARTTIWDYTVNFHNYPIPMPNWQVVEKDIEILIDHGASGIMLQGAYQGFGGENAAMRSWIWAKKLWDPRLTSKELMCDFVFGYFREAAGPIWEYQMMLWDIWERNHKAPSDANQMLCGIRYYPDIIFLQKKQYLDKALALFAKAQQLARDPVTKRRVDIARLPVLYVRVSQEVGFVDYYGAFQPRISSASDRAKLRALVDEFERVARIEGATHIREGQPDFAGHIKQLRSALDSDLSSSKIVQLDASWEIEPVPADDAPAGKWYRQRFLVPADFAKYKHVYMWFGGVGDEAVIYINGKPAWDNSVSHAMPKMDLRVRPFYFDVTGRTKYEHNRHPLQSFPGFEHPKEPYVRFGEENTIAVRVTSIGSPAGIYKPVYLIATDQDTLLMRPD